MLESFEKIGKPTFKDDNERCYIRFGSVRDKDADVGIRSGQLVLEGCVLQIVLLWSLNLTISLATGVRSPPSSSHLSTGL